MFLRFQEENTFWQKIPSRVGNDQLSINFTRLIDYLKSSDIFCPRKLFWAKIPLPTKALQKISLDFCLKNQSCYRRHAGRRTDFWDQKPSDFSRHLLSGEEFLPRTAFSGKKCRSILSNQVISWNRSRADRCPLGREFSAKTCSLLENEGTLSDFERFFLEKRPWKRFSTNVLIRGKWIHSTAN